MISFLRTAQASGERWGLLAKSVVSALGPLPPEANFGLAYATEELAEDFASIITFLRETTPIKQWTTAIGAGVIGPLSTVRGRPGLAVLVAGLPEGSFQRLESWEEPSRDAFLEQHSAWIDRQGMSVALIHGGAGLAGLPAMIKDLAAETRSFPVGGVTPLQPGGLSGVLLGSEISIATGLTQGCTPLSGAYRITEGRDDVVMALDGRPALEVMRDLCGPDIAQDLRKAAGVIHVGLPVAGTDRGDYMVRPLVAIDPARGWIAVNAEIGPGGRMLFVRRDGDSAGQDMRRMLADLAQRCQGKTIRGGLYVSCVARGEEMFGSNDVEPQMIKDSLGEFPLIGIVSLGEICHDRIYGFTGVLALILS